MQGCLFDDGFENGRVFVGGFVIEKYNGTACDDWAVTGINFYEIDSNTICQCTGLKDKNGNLIWENDIVDFLGHKGTVVFECGSFGIAYKTSIDWNGIEANIKPITGCDNRLYACENDNYISLWEIYWNFNDEDDSVNTVEVIGNIFDNKELLESEE
nr:MAG TPA: YopX protein [Caudoviricetes sp.]